MDAQELLTKMQELITKEREDAQRSRGVEVEGNTKPEVPKEQPKGEARTYEEKDGKVVCSDGSCYIKEPKNPKEIIKMLDDDYHSSHDFMSCPGCRKDTLNAIVEGGPYEYEDKFDTDGYVTVRKKKTDDKKPGTYRR